MTTSTGLATPSPVRPAAASAHGSRAGDRRSDEEANRGRDRARNDGNRGRRHGDDDDHDDDRGHDGGADRPVAVPNELIVRFDPSSTSRERDAARRRAGTMLVKRLPMAGMELLRVNSGTSLAQAEARLDRESIVMYVERNFYRRASRTPNDPLFGSLWALNNTGQRVFGVTGAADADIDAPEAWTITTGDTPIGVAVIDSGLDMSHRDLSSAIWVNPGESGGGKETNGRDDDGNGAVDDFRGWDWVDSDNNPQDGHGHGTHVAGTIGARADDGSGIPGVDWSARLMNLRVLDNNGGGSTSNIVQAYSYAGRKGARVVNASLGGGGFSRSEYDVIRLLPNVIFVVAAGNDAGNNDQLPEYPCAYDLGNVVCVAASNQQDALASFSNYGVTSVDLAAPGTSILSSSPGGGHVARSGTSMATPHVAGAAALVFSRSPATSVAAVRSSLLQFVDRNPGLAGKVATGGRLNIARTLGLVESPPLPTSPPAAPPAGPVSSRDSIPPRVSLRVRKRQRLRRALRRGVRAHVRCSEPCRLTVRLLVRGRSGRVLKLLGGRRPSLPGRRLALGGKTSKTVFLRLRASMRKRLARARRVRVVVTLTAKDGAGNVTRKRRALTLRR